MRRYRSQLLLPGGYFDLFRLPLSIAILSFFIVSCGGGGGSDSLAPSPSNTPDVTPTPRPTASPTPTPTPTPTVTISGNLTFDLVPQTNGGALNYDDISVEPVRGVVVELVNQNGETVDRTISDDTGGYELEGESQTTYKVRVLAHLDHDASPTWDISVTDNVSQNALYVMEGAFASSGSSNSVRNLHAASGWNATSNDYTSERSAAPFAILDAVYVLLKNLQSSGLTSALPTTELRWSTQNRASAGGNAEGNIGTSKFDPGNNVIYILGDKNNDTDEYDRSVVQHEFFHYFETAVSRSDSIGGSHGLSDLLDMRVAFGEGLANALAAGASGEPLYRDSAGPAQSQGFGFSLETTRGNRGWYSEDSIGNIVYDIIDDDSETGDNLDLGLGPVIQTLERNSYARGSSMISIFLFLQQLREITSPSVDVAINSLAQDHQIFGNDEYGSGETNDGEISVSLPVYHQLNVGQQIQVCSRGDDDNFYNALEVNRFIRVDIPRSAFYQFRISKSILTTGNKNPNAFLYRLGEIVATMSSNDVNVEERREFLSAGEHILEVYDVNNRDRERPGGAACFDVTVNEV